MIGWISRGFAGIILFLRYICPMPIASCLVALEPIPEWVEEREIGFGRPLRIRIFSFDFNHQYSIIPVSLLGVVIACFLRDLAGQYDSFLCVFLLFLRRPNPLSFPVCVISSSIFLSFLCVSFLTLFYGSCLASSHEECQVYRTKQLSCISTLSLFFSLTFTRLLSLYLFPNSLRSLLLTHLLTSPFRPIILVSSPSETYDQAYLLFLYHLVFFFLPFLLFLLFLSSPSL